MMPLKNAAVIVFSFCTCPSADSQYFNLLGELVHARRLMLHDCAGAGHLHRQVTPTGWSPLAFELPSITLASEVEESAAYIAAAANTLTRFNENHKVNLVMCDGDRATVFEVQVATVLQLVPPLRFYVNVAARGVNVLT